MRLETLYESSELPRFDMPSDLQRLYGSFGLSESIVYANFVSSVDGVAAIPGEPRSSALISGGDESDRFIVALLRSVADVVVIGAGTFREHRGPWTAEAASPALAAGFAELRKLVATGTEPRLVVVSASGNVDGARAKLRDTVIATTEHGARRLASAGATVAGIETFGDAGTVDVHAVIEQLRREGHRRILTEGGPQLMGGLLAAGLVDELFLTVSPVLAGGGRLKERPVLSGGAVLVPDAPVRGEVLSVRRADDYLFLRYRLSSA